MAKKKPKKKEDYTDELEKMAQGGDPQAIKILNKQKK